MVSVTSSSHRYTNPVIQLALNSASKQARQALSFLLIKQKNSTSHAYPRPGGDGRGNNES